MDKDMQATVYKLAGHLWWTVYKHPSHTSIDQIRDSGSSIALVRLAEHFTPRDWLTVKEWLCSRKTIDRFANELYWHLTPADKDAIISAVKVA